MRRFVEGIDRGQATLFPECLEEWIDADNPVRVIDAFVEKLDLSGLGFRWSGPRGNRPTFISRRGRWECASVDEARIFVNNAHKFTRAELVADLDGEV